MLNWKQQFEHYLTSELDYKSKFTNFPIEKLLQRFESAVEKLPKPLQVTFVVNWEEFFGLFF